MEARTTAHPDDVLRDIFFRIKNDRAALFRCATVCKQWRRIIADPSFLRCCWPTEKELYSFAGFFAPGRRHGLPLSFAPAPRSPMGPARGALVSFLPSSTSARLDRAKLLASRHGLLLMFLPAFQDTTTTCPAVCNPLAGTCDLLPPLNWGTFSNEGYAILTATDSPGATVHYFKVLLVDMTHGVCTFSSDQPTCWTLRKSSILCRHGLDIQIFDRDAVVSRGRAHWLGYNNKLSCLCIIKVNADNGHVSMTILVTNPTQFRFRYFQSSPCLIVDGDNTLWVIWKKQTEHLGVEIWKQEDNEEDIDEDDDDNGTSTWHCARVIDLKMHHEIQMRGCMYRILGEKCGMLLIHDGVQPYVAHIETGIMEEVLDWPRGHLNHGEARPFEIDWVTFFVSRLASQ